MEQGYVGGNRYQADATRQAQDLVVPGEIGAMTKGA
jgi:hypothetical protein